MKYAIEKVLVTYINKVEQTAICFFWLLASNTREVSTESECLPFLPIGCKVYFYLIWFILTGLGKYVEEAKDNHDQLG